MNKVKVTKSGTRNTDILDSESLNSKLLDLRLSHQKLINSRRTNPITLYGLTELSIIQI